MVMVLGCPLKCSVVVNQVLLSCFCCSLLLYSFLNRPETFEFGRDVIVPSHSADKLQDLDHTTGVVGFASTQLPNSGPAEERPTSGPSIALLPDEVILILKTGQATPQDRLRAQLDTFASSRYGRTPRNTIIISDADQIIDTSEQVWRVVDVVGDLANITSVSQSDKFHIYRAQQERAKTVGVLQTEDAPGVNNEGWTLDALKFLPGYSRAVKQFPDAKWFIGLDDDNYLFWDSLMQFLALFDSDQKLYLGSPTYMVANNVKFAHGGSVTISSGAAVRARFIDNNQTLGQFHEAATKFCCGDGILAMAYAEVQIPLTDHYGRFFNGEPIQDTEISSESFCVPLLGVHHLTGNDIRAVDEEIGVKHRKLVSSMPAVTTRGDLLAVGLAFQSTAKRHDWDFTKAPKSSIKHDNSTESAAACEQTCMSLDRKCLAWTYDHEINSCTMSSIATRGRSANSRTSGLNQIAMQNLLLSCSEQDWRQAVLDKGRP